MYKSVNNFIKKQIIKWNTLTRNYTSLQVTKLVVSTQKCHETTKLSSHRYKYNSSCDQVND